MAHDNGPTPWTVFVSDALQARLDTCRGDTGTATAIVFEAIDALRDQLPEVLRGARARPRSPHARGAVHHLGSGPVQLRLHPDTEQSALLERLSAELGAPATTWLPPLLNAHLPGRKEPANIPWLTPENP